MLTLPCPTPTDAAELADVMFDAVRNGPSKYTPAQRAAWVPERRRGVEWESRLAAKDIAITRDDIRIIGFMSIEGGGYIDFAFIRPDTQGAPSPPLRPCVPIFPTGRFANRPVVRRK